MNIIPKKRDTPQGVSLFLRPLKPTRKLWRPSMQRLTDELPEPTEQAEIHISPF